MIAETVLTLGKALLWTAIVFGPIAGNCFAADRDQPRRDALESASYMAFCIIAMVQGLALVGIFDTMSVILGLLAVKVGLLWHRDRHRFVRDVNTRLHDLRESIFDILDGVRPWHSLVGAPVAGLRRRLQALLATGRAHAVPLGLFAGLLVAVVIMRTSPLLASTGPDHPRERMHIELTQQLGANQLHPEGYVPAGAHALVALLRILTLSDELLLWKLQGPLLAVFTGLVVMLATYGLGAARSLAIPALAASLAAFASGSALLTQALAMPAVHPRDVAALLALIAVAVFAACGTKSANNRLDNQWPNDTWPGDGRLRVAWARDSMFSVAAASGAVAFVHPVAWLALALALTIAACVGGDFGMTRRQQRIGRIAGIWLGGLPAGVVAGLAISWGGVADGALGMAIDSNATGTARGELIALLITGGVAAAYLIGWSRGAPRRLADVEVGTCYLVLCSLTVLLSVAAPHLLHAQVLFAVAIPIATLCHGLAALRLGRTLAPWRTRRRARCARRRSHTGQVRPADRPRTGTTGSIPSPCRPSGSTPPAAHRQLSQR